MSRQLSFGRRRDSDRPAGHPPRRPGDARGRRRGEGGTGRRRGGGVLARRSTASLSSPTEGGRCPRCSRRSARRCRRPPTATSDSSARRAATRRRRRRSSARLESGEPPAVVCAAAAPAAVGAPRRVAREIPGGLVGAEVWANLSEAFGVDGGGALGGAAARPRRRDGCRCTESRRRRARCRTGAARSSSGSSSSSATLSRRAAAVRRRRRRRRPRTLRLRRPRRRGRGAARRGGAPRTGRESGAPQVDALLAPPALHLQCFSSVETLLPLPAADPTHHALAELATLLLHHQASPPPPAAAAASSSSDDDDGLTFSGGVVLPPPASLAALQALLEGSAAGVGRETVTREWGVDGCRSLAELLDELRTGESALCEVRGPGPSPPRLLLYRRALRLHIEWEAELPWQSLLMVVTHEGRADAPPRAVHARPLLSVRRGETPSAALARGLPLYGLSCGRRLDPPRRARGALSRSVMRTRALPSSRRRGTCAACWGDGAPRCGRTLTSSTTRAARSAPASGGGVRGCMHRRWRRRRGRRSRCGPRRCGRRRRRRRLGVVARRHRAARRRRAAVAVARRVAAQSIGRRVVIARHRRLAAPRQRLQPVIAVGVAAAAAAASLPAPPSSPAAAVPCVCVGRREEGLPLRLETALGAACARLGHGGGPALWGGIALVKYRLLASLPLGARLLSLRALRTDGSSLPPCVCVLPAAGADGGIAPPPAARVGAARAHRQLRVVLGERLPVPLTAADGAGAATLAGAAGAARWRRRCRRRRSS